MHRQRHKARDLLSIMCCVAASGALGRYTPSKTLADSFQLGVARPRSGNRVYIIFSLYLIYLNTSFITKCNVIQMARRRRAGRRRRRGPAARRRGRGRRRRRGRGTRGRAPPTWRTRGATRALSPQIYCSSAVHCASTFHLTRSRRSINVTTPYSTLFNSRC